MSSLSLLGSSDTWTIMDEGGATAITFTSFINMDLKTENKIIQSPVEQGSFVAYNKVQAPLDIGLQVAISGSALELEVAVTSLLEMSKGTQLVSLITPEQEYKDLNLTKLAWRRAVDDGTNIIYIDCGLSEVRQVTSEYTNAKVANKKSRGRQQPKKVETSAAAGIRDTVKGWL